MQRSTLDLWVGIFVVGGLAALLVLGLKVGNLSTFNMSESYEVHADFANIGGLKVKAPVKSAGVVVGRVSSIVFDNNTYEAKVTFRIDKRYQFPKDTAGAILTSGLLGEQYIGLEAGGDTTMFKDGDKFKLTQSAIVLESLISQFLFSKASDGAEKTAK